MQSNLPQHYRQSAQQAQGPAAKYIQEAVSLLAGSRELIVRPEQWDADPWLLNLTNGTLDLRTVTLRPHRPEDFLTKQAPVAFDPTAKAPKWQAHLDRCLPDRDVQRQIQRDLGMSLVGGMPEKRLFVWHGVTANGKSVTARVINEVLGSYADYTTANLLVRKRHDRQVNEMATLAGARLVFTDDFSSGRGLTDIAVSRLTGEDIKRARFIYQKPFEFRQTFLVTMMVNLPPRIRCRDKDRQRAVRVIPWTVIIPKSEQRPFAFLLEELLFEGPGVLNWLLAGLADWRADPHWVAPACEAATKDACERGRY